MTNRIGASYALMSAVLLYAVLPLTALAHEQQHFLINGKEYHFVIGSLNEPITVDDKTGVDLRVSTPQGSGTGHDHDSGEPVTGLEETLKIELIAGDKKKVQTLSPVYNTPGSYKTTFYPTVATGLTYRVFGDINGTSVDLSFTCTPTGHDRATESKDRVQVSQGVERIFKSGSFGCPAPKAELGFPEASAEIAVQAAAIEAAADARIAYAALVLAFLALSATFIRHRGN